MPRESWTRRLDDGLFGATGLAITFALVAVASASSAVLYFIDHTGLSAVIYSVLAVISGQASRTQWRRRSNDK